MTRHLAAARSLLRIAPPCSAPPLTSLLRARFDEVYPRLKWKLYQRPPASFALAAPALQPLFLFNVEPSHYFEWQVRGACQCACQCNPPLD